MEIKDRRLAPPATGIILDAPPHWRGTPDPLDTPETFQSVPTANGDFGPGWLYR